jgi:hypothetical protein
MPSPTPSANPDDALGTFLTLLDAALTEHSLQKLLLSKYRGSEPELQRLEIRAIALRNEPALSFVYSYKTRSITKNHKPEEAQALIAELLGGDFKSAHLHSDSEEVQLSISKKGKSSLHRKAQVHAAPASTEHNRQKKRFVDVARPFLQALGVTDAQQQVIPAMSRKWKQINKFIEVFGLALEQSPIAADKAIEVVDFGSGKGYLTFAIHDYLRHNLKNNAQVSGVELRPALTELCNSTAATLDYEGLNFVCGDVQSHAPAHCDVMIALHACDTATDYAIHYGIRANASIIMCSPCCHKEIRPQLHSNDLLKPMLQYGVHLGQQAEMLTDALRALLLEAHGYQCKVFEFISLEHTNKNKMILAVKKQQPSDNSAVLAQIADLKAFYGIEEHCLESLLNASAAV